MKNLGYPVTIESTTRSSPSSYPTLSFHVGRQTEIACGVNGGTGEPSTVVVSVFVDIVRATRGCDSGLENVRVACHCSNPNKAPAADPFIRQPTRFFDLADGHHPSPQTLWPTWIGNSSGRQVLTQEDSETNVQQYGNKFSMPRPQQCPPLQNLDPTGKRSFMGKGSHRLTETNAKSRWTPTEVSSTTLQVNHHPSFRSERMRSGRMGCSYQLEGTSDADREEMKTRLNRLIVSVFRKLPALSYYQGYHDIISVLFLTLPPEILSVSVEKLSLHRLRDSMGSGLEPMLGLLRLLKNLLRLADPEYAQLLERNIPTPFYALSNLLTLFSHDMPTLALIQHTFDYLLVRPPVACVYVAAAIILSRKEEIAWLEAVGEEGMLHSILSSLPALYEEGEEGDPQFSVPEAEATQGARAGGETGAVDERPKVDALPNGHHAPGPAVESEEPSVVGPVVDSSPSTPPPSDVTERVQSLPTDSIPHDAARNLSTPSPDTSTTKSDTTAVDEEPLAVKSPAFTDNETTLVDETTTKVEFEETKSPRTSTPAPPSESEPDAADPWPDTPGQPAKTRMSLSSLLRQADDLFARFPPSHPKLDLDKIMGPRSVIFTWTESFSSPPDDELEQYVKTPQLVVLPYVDPVEEARMKEKQEREIQMRKLARRGKLRKSVFSKANVPKKTILAGAVLALGITLAVYGVRAPGDAGGGRHRGDWRLLRYVGRLLLAGGDKLVARLLGH